MPIAKLAAFLDMVSGQSILMCQPQAYWLWLALFNNKKNECLETVNIAVVVTWLHTFLLRFLITCGIGNSNQHQQLRFSLLSINVAEVSTKEELSSTGQKVTLFAMIGGFRSIL